MRIARGVPGLLAGIAALAAIAGTASAQPVRNRTSILLDSSSSMVSTPEIVTFAETCAAAGWNGCTATGNPSVAQEQCNACMAWTVRSSPTCATSFAASCRATYQSCWQFVTGSATGCGQTLGVTGGIATRGDGTELTPGCDVDGDGLANDSRLYQAKEALRQVVAAPSTAGAELSLWRFAQVEGGQACIDDASCPDTPGGQSLLTCETIGGADRCALDAALLGSASGQCNPSTWNGAASAFSCAECSDTGSDRLVCEAYALGRIRTGGTSPLLATVNCALPTEDRRFTLNQGAVGGAGCDPAGADRLVDFPATGLDDNRVQIEAQIDHQLANLDGDVEISAHGASPLAAALRDLRSAVLASAAADTSTPCRRHQVVLVTDGAEGCETVSAAVAAAASLQDLSFTNASGVPVAGYDVPVHVIGFAICPPGTPNCQTRQDLNAIAAAGGTGGAIAVASQLELALALEQIVADSIATESCNDVDDDCDGATDEDFSAKGASCSTGLGACVASGQLVCAADELGLICDGTPGTPTDETCNGIDDDCDGAIDEEIECPPCTPNCPACGDGLDNDGDQLVDFPADPGCASAMGAAEDPECDDGMDNDGDDAIDFPADGGCESAADPLEIPEPAGALRDLTAAGVLWILGRRSRRADG